MKKKYLFTLPVFLVLMSLVSYQPLHRKKMDPEAEIWLQRLKQLLKNIQNQRNDLDFQKFCYQQTKYFRKSEQN